MSAISLSAFLAVVAALAAVGSAGDVPYQPRRSSRRQRTTRQNTVGSSARPLPAGVNIVAVSPTTGLARRVTGGGGGDVGGHRGSSHTRPRHVDQWDQPVKNKWRRMDDQRYAPKTNRGVGEFHYDKQFDDLNKWMERAWRPDVNWDIEREIGLNDVFGDKRFMHVASKAPTLRDPTQRLSRRNDSRRGGSSMRSGRHGSTRHGSSRRTTSGRTSTGGAGATLRRHQSVANPLTAGTGGGGMTKAVKPKPAVVPHQSALALPQMTGCFRQLKPSINIHNYERLPEFIFRQTFDKRRLIGQGTFGKIYNIQEYEGGPPMALKSMKLTVHLDLMQKEIDIMYSMSSKFVTRIHRRYVDNHNVYIVMDLAPFGDGVRMVAKIRDILHNPPDRELFAKLCLRDLVLGLAEVHSFGHVHHDMKWDNVLVFTTHVALADFGLAMRLRRNYREGSIRGTYRTLPPEYVPLRESSFYDDRGDIWALGEMAYELIFGYNPFYSKDRSVLEYRIHNYREFKIPSAYSDEFYDFLHRCLTHHSLRFQTIYDVYYHPWFDDVRYIDITEKVSPWMDIYLNASSATRAANLNAIRRAGTSRAATSQTGSNRTSTGSGRRGYTS